MKICKIHATLALLCSLLIANCSYSDTEGYITSDLQGEWERDVETFWPEGQTVTTAKGKIVLTSNTITIIGPSENLKGYTRNTELEAYIEKNNLYIKDRDAWQSPIAYKYWEAGKSSGKPPEKMLTLGTAETFKKNTP